MGVTYAGQPAVLDFDRTVEKFVAARWPESRWPMGCSRFDFETITDPFTEGGPSRFALPYPEVPTPRLNEVIIPTGASRYARGLFLFGRVEMAAIAQTIWGYAGDLSSIPSTWGLSNFQSLLRIAYDHEAAWPMFALPPVRVDASGGNGLWILPLVDARYAIQETAITGTATQGETWDGMLSRISNSSFQVGFVPPTPAAAGIPDRESFSNPALPYGVALDVAALSIGYRVVPRPVSNQLIAWLDSPSAIPPANTAGMVPWSGGAIPANVRPSEIKFVGRASIDHSDECRNRYIRSEPLPFGSGPLKPTIHLPWYVRSFRERVSAVVEIVADTDAETLFLSLCTGLAAALSAWNDQSYSWSIPGVHPWVLSGRDDYISYRVAGTDGLDSVSTHVQSLPPNFYPLVSLCQDPAVYVHPTDSAVFRLTADEDADGWAFAQIVAADGPYLGADRREVLVKIANPECMPALRECDEIIAHYQCGVDFGDESGLAGWVFNPFAQSLDGWEVEATLDDSIKGLDATGSAEFVKVRSTFPHVLEPPGIDENRKIAFHNPWRVDGVCSSPVILQLVTDPCRPPLDGEGFEVSSCGYSSAGTPRWEIKEAARRRARMILFQYTGGTPDVLDYWYGEDPTGCGDPLVVEYPLGEPCEPCEVMADYDPHSGVYLARDTRASMLGEPEELDVVNSVGYDDTGCEINYVRQSILAFPCGSEPSSGSSSPVLTSLDVITGVSLIPPVPECTGYAEYTWNPGTYVWDLTTPCPSGCVSTPPVGIPPDPGVPGSPVTSLCTNPPESPASPGYLSFAKSSILVCGYTSASPATIELAECPEEPPPP